MSKRKPYIPIEEIEGEVWRPINGYEELYAVSNMGRVKMIGRKWLRTDDIGVSERINLERIMPAFLSHNGYHRVALYKDKKVKKYQLHRLVAQEFIPNPENKKEINHINGVKLDNIPENLEWCTRQENAIHACRTGLMKPMKGGINANAKRILCTTLGLEFSCLPEAEEVLGINRSGISKVINNKKPHVFGLVFRNM